MNRTGRESAPGAAQEPDGRAAPGPHGESVETALQLAIDLHGPGLLNRPEKLRQQLEGQCPHAGFDISFLLVALDEKVPQALLAMNSALQMQTVVPQLQEMLAERRGLNPFAATWAVSTWAAALRMDLFGDAAVRGSIRPGGGAQSAGSRPFDTGGPGRFASDAPQDFGTKTTAAPAPFTVPFGIQATRPVASVAPAPVEPRIVVPFPTRPSEPVSVTPPLPHPEAVAEAPTQPVVHAVEATPSLQPAEPAPDAVGLPQPIPDERREPLRPVEAAEPLHRSVIDEPAVTPPKYEPAVTPKSDEDDTIIRHEPAVAAPVTSTTEAALPTWAAAKKKAPTPENTRFKPWWGIAGVVAAVIVAGAAIRVMSSLENHDDAPTAAPEPAAPAVVAPSPAPVAAAPAPVVATPAPVVAAPTPPSIVDVVSDGTLLGDGAEHAVFVAIDPARRDVRSVEATFMAGDAPWEPRARMLDVSPDMIRDGRIAVGSIGLRTARPATTTIQYVVTAANGERSTPFVKQFVFAPVAARAPVIADIVVPTGLVAGTPFTLTIRYAPGDSGIASVERTIVGTDGPPRTTSLAGLASPKEGTLRYPVEAIASASRTTYAFTLVDRDGARSEPRNVVVDVAAPKREAERTADAASARPESVACTRSTCGTIVSVREIDRTKTYEIIARMDDRTIRSMVSSALWKVGTRVRPAGSRLAPVDAAVAPVRAKGARRTPGSTVPESPPIVDR